MTQPEALRLADWLLDWLRFNAEPSDLEAAFVGAAAEREACAKVCESYTDNHGGKYADCEGHGYECAAAIRARGDK